MSLQRDLRSTAGFEEIQAAFARALKPGSGAVVGADELAVSPTGTHGAFAGVMMEKLEGQPSSRICSLDLRSQELRVMSFGPNSDRSPKWCDGGRSIAYLSDREQAGNFQLYILNVASGESRRGPAVEGWIEYLHVSPDGGRLLLGVAGFGADLAGAQGGSASQKHDRAEAWMPQVESGEPEWARRSLWLARLHEPTARRLSPQELNIWEACWCGSDRVAAVSSPGASETHWYAATLELLEVDSSAHHTIYKPRDQMGWPAASPDGRWLALAGAVCSDRWVVAGELILIDTQSGEVRQLDTRNVDVSDIQWIDNETLLYSGHRSFETVTGRIPLASGEAEELLAASDYTWGDRRYPRVAPLPGRGDWIMVRDSFLQPPRIQKVEAGRPQTLHRFLPDEGNYLPPQTSVEELRWTAPDGLEIHGWLVQPPPSDVPQPLVMDVHGGPVWLWRQHFLGKGGHHKALLERGCALFFPNPRGSSGRGQDFARQVFGDMGGADTHDYLSGLDHLVERGDIDPARIGVTGGSYGGFMSNWLITQDQRFAAAVPVVSISNWVSEHLICNIPHFCELFLADDYRNLNGKYFSRSPIYFAHQVKTPTLNICGALDRCTPPNQDKEFHQALQLNGVESMLVSYPLEGHGPRRFPAVIDYSARVVDWFSRHLALASSPHPPRHQAAEPIRPAGTDA